MSEAVRGRRSLTVMETDELARITDPDNTRTTVFYNPRTPRHYRTKTSSGPPRFPTPQIRPRQRRPHSIHIISYPPGYVPYELRLLQPPEQTKPRKQQAEKVQTPRRDRQPLALARERTTKRVFGTLLDLVSCQSVSSNPAKLIRPPTAISGWTTSGEERASVEHRRHSSFGADLSMTSGSAMVEAPRPPVVGSSNASATFQRTLPTLPALPQLSGIISARSVTNGSITNFAEFSKPVASGSGLTCSILFAEPNLFLSGFDHDNRHRGQQQPTSTALLRGKLQLSVSKNVKIKSVTLKLSGRARTEWPEGIPPTKTNLFEESSLRTQVLTFFHALHDGWETPFGNQCVANVRSSSPATSPTNSSVTNLASLFSGAGSTTSLFLPGSPASSSLKPTSKEHKRLSLQSSQNKNVNKDETPPEVRPSAQVAKGFRVFHPGTYEYSFEIPIDHHQLETTDLPFGSVKWELETIVERAGAFKPNLHGTREVAVVRVPDQLSLETTDPIVISRQWEDQLHYDITISGKSFPIGSKIPIAFKLTPLAKVQLHKLKVLVTESVEYWTNDRKVTRKDQGRKVLLLEKAAGKPVDERKFEGCEVRVLAGGESGPEDRERAMEEAARRSPQPSSASLRAPSDNLLGDLDLGLESFWGSTEIEMNVQIPTCSMMHKDKTIKMNPDCSWKNVNVFHWIKLVMRISRLDEADPARQRRRHFEISIDSPITLLNCRASQANTLLPQYVAPTSLPPPSYTAACGCRDASQISVSDMNSLTLCSRVDTVVPRPIHFLRKPSFAPPTFEDEDPPPPISPRLPDSQPGRSVPQPLSLIIPPSTPHSEPPVMSPPPCYDTIVGTPSVDGLADYFSRLANYEDDDSSSSDGVDGTRPARLTERTGRVNVANPMSPGGFGEQPVPSRSLELQRPVRFNMPSAPGRRD